MPWEKSYNDRDVLDSATRAFWAKGFEATSMADLVQATGINRGSIYSAFTDKRTLFLRSLEHYDQNYCTNFLNNFRDNISPKQAIFAMFEAIAKPGKDLPGGCLMVNTALEMSPHDEEIAKYVDSRIAEVENFFHDCIVAAQAEGTIRPDVVPRSTAQTLLGLMIGLRVLTRATSHKSAIAAILAQVHSMLD